jgi:hypothetical protein
MTKAEEAGARERAIAAVQDTYMRFGWGGRCGSDELIWASLQAALPHMGGPTREAIARVIKDHVYAHPDPSDKALAFVDDESIGEAADALLALPPQPERTGEVAGWKLVPVIVSQDMMGAAINAWIAQGRKSGDIWGSEIGDMWRAMLSAAPAPPASQDHERD